MTILIANNNDLLLQRILNITSVKMVAHGPRAAVPLLKVVHVRWRGPIIVEKHTQQNQRRHALQVPGSAIRFKHFFDHSRDG